MLLAFPSDDEILAAIRSWIDDLVADDYATALSRTELDPYYQWTPTLLKAVVASYGPSSKALQTREWTVTPRTSASGSPLVRLERSYVPQGALAYVEHTLPLDGQWSDLTAAFRVEPRAEGAALILENVRVL
jgi:hypothetical protein